MLLYTITSSSLPGCMNVIPWPHLISTSSLTLTCSQNESELSYFHLLTFKLVKYTVNCCAKFNHCVSNSTIHVCTRLSERRRKATCTSLQKLMLYKSKFFIYIMLRLTPSGLDKVKIYKSTKLGKNWRKLATPQMINDNLTKESAWTTQ